ncbi:MAG: ABC transporter permease subunit [Nitrospinota bacterium]
MRNVWAIYKRELAAYFYSPIAYVVITIFLAIMGYLFYSAFVFFSIISMQGMQNPALAGRLNVTSLVVEPLFANMGVVLLLMIPVLTMRLFSEEKRQGTMELLLTYPIRDGEVLFGKYLAALTVFALMLALTSVYLLFVFLFSEPEPGPIFSSYLGIFLLGAAFIAVGVFISSLTQNQIVAAAATFGVLLISWLLGFASSYAGGGLLSRVLSHVALANHLDRFLRGMVDTRDMVYLLNLSFFSLFLTLRSLESNRWRG